MNKTESDNYQELAVAAVGLVVAGSLILFLAVAWPTLVWSTLHGEPTLVGFLDAVFGGLRWVGKGASGDPRLVSMFAPYRDVMPPPNAWIALDAVLVCGVVMLVATGWSRVDGWRGSRSVW